MRVKVDYSASAFRQRRHPKEGRGADYWYNIWTISDIITRYGPRSIEFLGAILCIGGALCFAVAYHLHHLVPKVEQQHITLNHPVTTPKGLPSISIKGPKTRYLSYLPHSGFHNQRIELENALVLAALLNRTLLLPPARLGAPLRYLPYGRLSRLSEMATKDGLEHCSRLSSYAQQPDECLDADTWTAVPWHWLVDLDDVPVRFVERWDPGEQRILDALGLQANDSYTLEDKAAYDLRYVDAPLSAAGSENLRLALAESNSFRNPTIIHLQELSSRPERIIRLGTLFGSSRLWLGDVKSMRLRHKIRKSMAFKNPYLDVVVNNIGHRIGGRWMGAHIRIGDGAFKTRTGLNIRKVWDHIVDEFNFDTEIRQALTSHAFIEDNRRGNSPDNLDVLKRGPLRGNWTCKGKPYMNARLSALHTPLFISTDAFEPRRNPDIRPFLETFPCTYFLVDFTADVAGENDVLAPLDNLVSSYDGLKLRKFLIPFVDAMVVSRAERFVGTTGSTFSQFVQDVLVPKWRGEDIHDR